MPDRPSLVNGWAKERDSLREEEHLRIVEVVHTIANVPLCISISEEFAAFTNPSSNKKEPTVYVLKIHVQPHVAQFQSREHRKRELRKYGLVTIIHFY